VHTSKQPLSLERTAVFGSTRLTLKLLEHLEDVSRPRFVLGLGADQLSRKANGVDLAAYCSERAIEHSVDDKWITVANQLERLDIETVLAFGESRLVPEFITSRYVVIGNHGAVLPDVQGGASLVWGRMADLGSWGVSLFRLNERVDSGPVLATSRFRYSSDVRMRDFVARADDMTIQAFRALSACGMEAAPNETYAARVEKAADTYESVNRMLAALEAGEPVYMPTRTPADSKVDPAWPDAFQRVFKLANDAPYPRWRT